MCCWFEVLGLVSLPGDLPALTCAEWLNEVEQRRISSIAELLNLLPVESSAVLTSANTLLTELFSHKGEPGHQQHTSLLITRVTAAFVMLELLCSPVDTECAGFKDPLIINKHLIKATKTNN